MIKGIQQHDLNYIELYCLSYVLIRDSSLKNVSFNHHLFTLFYSSIGHKRRCSEECLFFLKNVFFSYCECQWLPVSAFFKISSCVKQKKLINLRVRKWCVFNFGVNFPFKAVFLYKIFEIFLQKLFVFVKPRPETQGNQLSSCFKVDSAHS